MKIEMGCGITQEEKIFTILELLSIIFINAKTRNTSLLRRWKE